MNFGLLHPYGAIRRNVECLYECRQHLGHAEPDIREFDVWCASMRPYQDFVFAATFGNWADGADAPSALGSADGSAPQPPELQRW